MNGFTCGVVGQHERPQAQRYGLRSILGWLVILGGVGAGLAWAVSEGQMLRFSDTPSIHQSASPPAFTWRNPMVSEPDSAVTSAVDWLEHNGWKQLWPLGPLSKQHQPWFAGPATQRYLQLNADDTFYIWGRRVDIDPHRFPALAITWGVERFPTEASLDTYGRNDRAIVVTISLGPKLPSPGLLPDLPRALAFFWGETETVGASYTCVTPRQGPADRRMQCKYPHIKYIALRRGEPGSVYTDQVNLVEAFQQHFPEYWQQQQHVPPVVAVSFEARSDNTKSRTVARLYAITFAATDTSNGNVTTPGREGK